MVATPPQTDTYSTALDIFDRTHPLRVDADENLKVTVVGGSGGGTVDQGAPGALAWPVLNLAQLVPVAFDSVVLSPTGTNPTTILYKTGGIGGTTVATLALTYDANNNVQTVMRT